jgi:hypothetical protein
VKDGIPSGGWLWSDALTELLGVPRDPAAPLEDKHRDVARSAQATYENAFFNLLRALHERYAAAAVVLAGGCAYNSVANGKVFERSPFKGLCAVGRRRCRRRHRGGLRHLAQGRGRQGQAPLRDGSRLLGTVGHAGPGGDRDRCTPRRFRCCGL